MPGLTRQDLQILGFYADVGNRELYWNYLAQHAGSDGYGLLALGVVRNDNMPGAVANAFAQNHARNHSGRTLDEREWEQFGEQLIREDLVRREYYFGKQRPDLALNLPVEDVQRAHDASFRQHGIDPNAWTPRQLLEAARRQGGTDAAERVWHSMLDNSALGIGRAGITIGDIYRYDDDKLDAIAYLGGLVGASAMASQSRNNVDPDVIGATSFYYLHDRHDNGWYSVSAGDMGGPGAMRRVTDAGRIAELDDARAVRLARNVQAEQFHPLDPARAHGIAKSPWTLADAGMPPETTQTAMLDPAQPGHPDHALYVQGRDAVHRLDASLGRAPDHNSDCMIASVACLARQHGFDRIDHVVLSEQTLQAEPGEHVFVVQGRLDDPAHLRAHMKTQLAVDTPVAESFRQLDALQEASRQKTDAATKPVATARRRRGRTAARHADARHANANGLAGHQRSRIATTPMPPAVQIDTRQRPPPRCCSSLAAVATMRAPVAANGCPVASDEPLMLIFAGSMRPSGASSPSRVLQYSSLSHARSVHSTCAAKASWIS